MYSRFNVLSLISGKPFTSKNVYENLILIFSYKNKTFTYRLYSKEFYEQGKIMVLS